MTSRDSWGSCVILLGTFLTLVNTLGFSYSLGIYYSRFKDEFDASSSSTSLISGLNYGLLSSASPLSSVLVTRFGCRIPLVVGGALSVVGIAATAFAQSITHVIIFMGVVNGLGFGITFTAAVIVTSQHFVKYRNIALGVTFSGGGVGMMLYPYITGYLTENFGWRGAIFISSALQLHTLPVAILAKNPDETADERKSKDPQSRPTANLVFIFKRLYSPKYLVFLISTFLMVFAHAVVTTHIGAYVLSLDFDFSFAELLISILGCGTIIGRIFLAMVAQAKLLKVPTIYGSSLCITGLCILTVAFSNEYYVILISISIFGIFISITGPTLSEMAYVLSSVELFPYSYGFAMFLGGAGSCIGPSMAGLLYEISNIYPSSFYLGGSILLFAGALTLLTELLSRHFVNPQNIKLADFSNERKI